jgi:hypothetical protein
MVVVAAARRALEALMAAPNINSITPNTGLPNTATAVTIGGTGFTGATSVTFGGIAATAVVVVSDTSITCNTPLIVYTATVDVIVVTPGGSNTMFNGFTFQHPRPAIGSGASFPTFYPIFPPPPAGSAQATPAFPPPTPPPIGAVPVGPHVGPVVAAAAVPPSTAGFPLIRYGSGSATAPTAAHMFPAVTTTYPSPTIVFSNVYTGGNPPSTPPSTASTQNVPVGGWGPPVGPAFPPPSYVLPTGIDGGGSGIMSIDIVDNGPPDMMAHHKSRRRHARHLHQ